MEVKQVYTLLNTVTGEVTGKTGLVSEDLSNIVDVGKTLLSNTDVDNYVRTLINRVGKTVFDDRKYAGIAPNLLLDSWQFGSILQKISADLPAASENISSELTDGTDYSPNIFYKPTVSQKLFNKKITFEVNLSFTDRQVRESFDSADQLNAFYSMLYSCVENSLTIKLDSLIMRSIANMIGETLHDDFGSTSTSSGSHIKAVNLMALYNDQVATADQVSSVAEFLRSAKCLQFATYIINTYKDRLAVASQLFNIGGSVRFTQNDDLTCVLLSDFAHKCNSILRSNTYNADMVSLPEKSLYVPFWQGSGTDYSFTSVSKIDVTTASGDTVEQGGILGVMFDRNSVAVCNSDRRVTTNYNPRGEFYTNFFKYDCSYINDLNENFVVFFLA